MSIREHAPQALVRTLLIHGDMRSNLLGLGTAFTVVLTAPTAALAATCSFNAEAARLDVALAAEWATISASPAGAILLGGAPCGAATVASTVSIVVAGSSADDRLTIDVEHPFAARTAWSIQLDGGRDILGIEGSLRNDVIVAGAEGVDLDGDSDRDVVFTGVDRIDINGWTGNDMLSGEGGYGTGGPTPIALIFNGGLGEDVLIGGTGNDSLTGGAGNDVLLGGAGNDALAGGDDNDYEDGGPGNDEFKEGTVNSGDDELIGGPGRDTANYSRRLFTVTITVDDMPGDGEIFGESDNVGSDIEIVYGGVGDDYLAGNEAANDLLGGAGADWIEGNGGEDKIYGGAGEDFLFGGDGVDYIYGGDEADYLSGGTGGDYIEGGEGNDILNGDNGRDTFACGGGMDTVVDTDIQLLGLDCE